MLGLQRLGRALGIGGREDLVVVDVAPLAHRARRALAAHDHDLLERLQVAHHLVDALLDRRGLALARGAVDSDQHRACENSIRSRTASAEKPPKTTLWGAPMRAHGEHRDDDLRDHRQVDPDDVALAHTEVLQGVGEALDLGEQLYVGDVALGARPRRASGRRHARPAPPRTWRSRQL